jgi:hypothetical protein
MADCETMLLSTSAPTSATTVTHTTATSAATPPTVTTESHGPNAVVWDAEADADADADIDVVDWNANPTSSKRPASFDSNDDLLTGPGKYVTRCSTSAPSAWLTRHTQERRGGLQTIP